MIEERVGSLRHRDRRINPRPVGVFGLEGVRAVVLQQDVLAVIHVPLRLAVGDLLNPTAQAIVPVR